MMNAEVKKMEINEESLKNVNGGEEMNILPVLEPKGSQKKNSNKNEVYKIKSSVLWSDKISDKISLNRIFY